MRSKYNIVYFEQGAIQRNGFLLEDIQASSGNPALLQSLN